MIVNGTVVVFDKIHDTTLTAPQDVIDRATLPSVCLSDDSWRR
jgi:hypothetical protein